MGDDILVSKTFLIEGFFILFDIRFLPLPLFLTLFSGDSVGKTQAPVRLPRQAQGRPGPPEREYWLHDAPGPYYLSMTLRGVSRPICNY